MSEKRTLIRGGYVVSVDPEIGDLDHGDVLIEGSEIVEVGRDVQAADAAIIDASSMAVIPGFVDTHRHTWETILRSATPDCDIPDYFSIIVGEFAPHYRPEDTYAGNLLGALGALNAGFTTLLDWAHNQNTPDHADEAIRGLKDAGIRAVFAHGAPMTSMEEWWSQTGTRTHPEDMKRLRTQYFSSDDQLLTLAMALRGPEFSSLEVSKQDIRMSRDLGARITVHVGVGPQFAQARAVEQLHEAEVLGSDITYVHTQAVTDEAMRIIGETGGTLSLSSPWEARAGLGWPSVQRAKRFGLRPSLSVDCEISEPSDMFNQMRSTFVIDRGLEHARVLREGEGDPELLTAREVLEFATIEGARANGIDHKVGTITPGKKADLVLIDLDQINVFPVNDVIGAIVFGADTGNVRWVFVDGEARKREGRLVDAEIERVRALALSSRDYLYQQTGRSPITPPSQRSTLEV